MAKRRLGVILPAAIVVMFLAGCECNRAQCPGLYDNLTGADWCNTTHDCKAAWDAELHTWRDSIRNELSALDSNFNGDDWRQNVAGSCSCGQPACAKAQANGD